MCVNIWDYRHQNDDLDERSSNAPVRVLVVSALTDAPPRAEISMEDMDTLSTSAQTPQTDNMQGIEQFCNTHPEYSKMNSGVTYNTGVEIGLSGPSRKKQVLHVEY